MSLTMGCITLRNPRSYYWSSIVRQISREIPLIATFCKAPKSLVGALCCFRQEPVAFACDIEGMFHQVHVNEEHRDLLRFHWWEQLDTTKAPTEYRMTVHLFGATSSSGCANLALRTAADDGVNEFGVEAASFIKENLYVDDGLKSVPTVCEAIELIKNSTEMCMKGGFRLHKFTSNSKEVVELEKTRRKQTTVDGVTTRSASREYHPVDVNEISEAEQEIIRHLQKEAFKEEISKLKKITTDYETYKDDDSRSRIQKPKEASPLSRLDPHLDHSNLVRIGGRIKQASISQDVKHPIVLPGQGLVSKLLARHYHEGALHQGKGFTLNEIRSSGYWMIGSGSVVSRLVT